MLVQIFNFLILCTTKYLFGSVVSINLPTVSRVFGSNHALSVPHTCPLARIGSLAGRYVPPEVVAVRVPRLGLSNFQINDWLELSAKSYAIMVLMLPWGIVQESGKLVEVVADQVAVALSHAAILEESMRARDLLMEQNVDLDLARWEEKMAIRSCNDFLAVMNHEMQTPMHAITALLSLLLETKLPPEQRLMVEAEFESDNVTTRAHSTDPFHYKKARRIRSTPIWTTTVQNRSIDTLSFLLYKYKPLNPFF